MARIHRSLTGPLAVLTTLYLAGNTLSHLLTRRSLAATAAEWFLRRLSGFHSQYDTPEHTRAFMDLQAMTDEHRFHEAESLGLTAPHRIESFADMECCVFNPDSEGRTVYYLHGGSYVAEPLPFHWWFLDDLAHRTSARIVVPDYPLAPRHTWRDAYPLVLALYECLVEEVGSKNLVLMGDSAGGGLAAALSELLLLLDEPQPVLTVLISPWVDLTLSNPEIAPYEPLDPALSVVGQRITAEAWAGGTPMTDFMLSPLFGRLRVDDRAVAPVLLYTGTHEILYPDTVLFHDRLRDGRLPVELHVGENLDHCYPLYPIPEALAARRRIAHLVLRPEDLTDEFLTPVSPDAPVHSDIES